MTIAEAVKKFAIRVDNARKWLVYNEELELWIVYGRPRNARKTRVLITTRSEEEAVECLINT